MFVGEDGDVKGRRPLTDPEHDVQGPLATEIVGPPV